jgi:hypothetical protein
LPLHSETNQDHKSNKQRSKVKHTVTFTPHTTESRSVPKTKIPPIMDKVKCFKCDEMGHFAYCCPHNMRSLNPRSAGRSLLNSAQRLNAESLAPSTTITCSKCQHIGHFTYCCPNADQTYERRSKTTTSTAALTQTPRAANFPIPVFITGIIKITLGLFHVRTVRFQPTPGNDGFHPLNPETGMDYGYIVS